MFETWLWCQMLLSTVSLSIWNHLALQKYHRHGMYLQRASKQVLILEVFPKQKMQYNVRMRKTSKS